MTNKEAAIWLREHIDATPDGTKQSEAIEMAIEALEQQPCEDCISRNQAIIETYGCVRYTGIDEAPIEYVGTILRNLPSVTPLPKGHGRLIDADDIDSHIVGSVDTRDCPTIIEADKAESEDEE